MHAEAHPDLVTIEDVSLNFVLSQFSGIAVKEFYQTPVLDNSIFHSNLNVNKVKIGELNICETQSRLTLLQTTNQSGSIFN